MHPGELGLYPVTMTERLDYWAAECPDRVFLSEREGASWRTIAYGEFRHAARSVARGLIGKDSLEIRLGNGIEHAILAVAAMYAGVPYLPLRPGGTAPKVAKVSREAAATGSADTVVKWLLTSGSTGEPKPIAQTHRMLTSNQEMLRHVIPQLRAEPPVLCDWLPWHHTYGGNHNFGIALYNGGTLYVDRGTPDAMAESVRNLREVRPTIYFNVPRGYRALLECLRADVGFAREFLSRLTVMFCAGASLPERTRDELRELTGVPMLIGYGSTETGPMSLCCGRPAPGVEVKLVGRELCVRGPHVSPDVALDAEGFYHTGDAFRFEGSSFVFEGRLGRDFKLSSGTWVRVEALRQEVMSCCGPWVRDVELQGEDADEVTALVFPALDAPEDRIVAALRGLAARNPGTSRHVGRVVVVRESRNSGIKSGP